MKITAVETSVVSVPFDNGGPTWKFAGKAWTTLGMLLVKVETDAGITGWGEAFGHAVIPTTRVALDTLVAPLVLGRDARDIEAINRDLFKALHLSGRNGPCVYALSGIDIALWDIAGKAAGLPLYQMLGAAKPEPLEGYASLLRYGDPDLVGRATATAVGQGFKLIKLHEVTRDAVLAARDAMNGATGCIMLDTNCPWTPHEAVEMARALRNDGLKWLEEPVWPPEDHAGLARVRAEGIPIAAGENAQGLSEFKAMFEAGAVDYAQPSVTKVGGISEMRRIIALGGAYGVNVVPHCPYYGPGFLASLHIAASMPERPPVEVFWMDMEANPFDPWVRAESGHLAVPDSPGLGCDPDPDVVEKYQIDAPIRTSISG